MTRTSNDRRSYDEAVEVEIVEIACKKRRVQWERGRRRGSQGDLEGYLEGGMPGGTDRLAGADRRQ